MESRARNRRQTDHKRSEAKIEKSQKRDIKEYGMEVDAREESPFTSSKLDVKFQISFVNALNGYVFCNKVRPTHQIILCREQGL